MELLISLGHNADDVWGYTPRRINAFVKLASKRVARDQASNLSLSALAARGDPKDIKRQLKELSRL